MVQVAETKKDFVIGVISDTHVPDRCKALPQKLLTSLEALEPDLILHAGDLIVPKVVEICEEIAPVVMVRGNRDIYYFPYLPRKKDIYINGVILTLMHGHGLIGRYFINKLRYFLFRYRLDWFLPTILQQGENANVIVFGHTHRPMNEWRKGQLLFNPGSATISPEEGIPLSYGVLRISKTGEVASEIVEIQG